ncbi:MAG: hypothetical protein AAFQ10_03880 [Pseudomonadota bacterium]
MTEKNSQSTDIKNLEVSRAQLFDLNVAWSQGTSLSEAGISEPKKFAFFGYEVGGWGALLAFVISIVTLGLTAVDRWFLTANPIALPPEQINIVCQRHDGTTCEADSSLYITGVPIILINDTAAPHSFTAISSDVIMTALNKKGAPIRSIELAWQYIGDPRKPIGAITVAPQKNVSSEIQYHPRRTFDKNGNLMTKNFWKYSNFQSFVSSSNASNLKFEFKFNLLDSNPVDNLSAVCTVPIDADFRTNAGLGTFLLFSRECFPA